MVTDCEDDSLLKLLITKFSQIDCQSRPVSHSLKIRLAALYSYAASSLYSQPSTVTGAFFLPKNLNVKFNKNFSKIWNSTLHTNILRALTETSIKFN